MSDFDKEAERERLREKYGENESDREATEQMSELLLKGATMTNAHCNECGDPIFRYDGQEFCPSCQRPVDRGEERDDEENIEVTAPSDDATVQFGGQGASASSASASSDDSTTERQIGEAESQTPDRQPPSQSQSETPDRQSTGRQDPETPDRQPQTAPSVDPSETGTAGDAARQSTESAVSTGTSATDHLTNAQTLLAQTIEQNARLARNADSPRQAREYLETAREAAATLEEMGF